MRRWDKSKPPTGPFSLNKDCPQAQGLVAWWPIGGPSSKNYIPDMAGISHFDNASGTTSRLTRGVNGGWEGVYNGTSDYLLVATPITVATPISLHAFASSTSIATTQTMMSIGKISQQTEPAALLFVSSTAWALTQNGASNVQAQGATTLSSNVTYGVGGIWTTSTDRKVYLNGVQDGTNTTSSTPSGHDGLYIGRRDILVTTQYFVGNIGECAAWNIAVNPLVFLRLNDPSTRFELWYPLRSKKWISIGGAATGKPWMFYYKHKVAA